MEVKVLGKGDESIMENVAPDVFDDEIDAGRTREFLSDDRHHLVVALDGDLVIGFVSAVHYVHPDKPRPEFWINELGVAPSHQRRGLASDMMDETLGIARELGCSEAWLLTERENLPAMGLYKATGWNEESPDPVSFTFDLTDEPTE